MTEHMSPIPSRVYNAAVGGHVCGPEDVDFGQKVVHLIKYDRAGNEVSFESQVTQANKIYVIHDDFTLSSNVTIPAGCVLEFDGGSIIGANNCTLTMNDCYLQGLSKFNNVVFAGDIKNDWFDCTWIDNGNDIGAKINYAQIYFHRLFTPAGRVEFSTPIVVRNAIVEFNSDFVYTGPIINGEKAIDISASTCKVYLRSLTIDDSTRIDYTETRTVNMIGIAFTNCNNCDLYVDSVGYFNENIRCQGIDGSGCSYNHIHCLQNNNANMGIRFYQKNGGWANENYISGGRFTKYSSLRPYGKTYGIFIGGAGHDGETWADGATDTYDETSHITMYEGSFEHLDYILYVGGDVRTLSLIRPREEDVKIGLAKHVGVGKYQEDIYYQPGYDNIINTIDIEGCPNVSYNYPYTIEIDTKKRSYPENPRGNVFASKNSIHKKYADSDYLLQRGVVIDTSTNKIFQVKDTGKHIVKMLNDSGDTILPMSASQNTPVNSKAYNEDFNGFSWANTYLIPNNINKIFIGIIASDGANIEKLKISSPSPIKYTVDDFSVGTWDNKPDKMEQGVGYYCTDRNKLIYYNNTSNKWYDAAGNEVTA